MRISTHQLPADIESALAAQLGQAGHEIVTDNIDGAVIGIGEVIGETLAVDLEQSQWDQAIARTRTAFTAVRDAAAELRERDVPGRIVIVVNPAAVRVIDGALESSVAGAFLMTLAQVGAVELGEHGITVNTVVAGWTDSCPAKLVDGVPLGRLAEPGDIAAACEFLLSPGASYVNGSTLTVDGGFVITKGPDGSPLVT
jgi:NAD(P)-dependent dehydrogenase (short-subunit alcohol dehydrogenase family)